MRLRLGARAGFVCSVRAGPSQTRGRRRWLTSNPDMPIRARWTGLPARSARGSLPRGPVLTNPALAPSLNRWHRARPFRARRTDSEVPATSGSVSWDVSGSHARGGGWVGAGGGVCVRRAAWEGPSCRARRNNGHGLHALAYLGRRRASAGACESGRGPRGPEHVNTTPGSNPTAACTGPDIVLARLENINRGTCRSAGTHPKLINAQGKAPLRRFRARLASLAVLLA